MIRPLVMRGSLPILRPISMSMYPYRSFGLSSSSTVTRWMSFSFLRISTWFSSSTFSRSSSSFCRSFHALPRARFLELKFMLGAARRSPCGALRSVRRPAVRRPQMGV